MKYRDEFHIASTAILLSVAMVGISVVVPKESRVPTAKTTLTEAPETAAEAEAAQQEEFPIYSQDSNYDETYDYSQEDSSYDDSYDSSGGDSSGSDQITYPTEDSGDSSGSDTSDIPDYTEDEKKIIFTKFALPKILKRMSMKEEECVILPEALDEVVRRYSDTTGIRDLEQIEGIEGLQVYYRGVDPTPIKDFVMTSFNSMTKIGGAVCLPGDVVFGYGGGVIFIPSHMVKEVIEFAKKMHVKDIFGFEMIKQGVYTTADIDIDVWPTEMMNRLVAFIKEDERGEQYRNLDWSKEFEAAKAEEK